MSILLSILMIVGLFTIVPVTASAEDIASGTCGTCQWEIDEEGTLTIHAGKLPDEVNWGWKDNRRKIKSVVFEDNVRAGSTTQNMFINCYYLETINFGGFDTTNVSNMASMFESCESLTSLDLSSFDTSNVTEMDYMFENCKSLTSLDLSSFDTSSVTYMHHMFSECENLTSLDLSSFDTSNVTYIGYMFKGCSTLTSLDLSSFDMSKVTNSARMFVSCSSLERIYVKDASVNWNLSMNENSSNMFYGCTSLKGVKNGAVSEENVYDGNRLDASAAHVGMINGVQGYFTPLTQDTSLNSFPEFVNFTLDGII